MIERNQMTQALLTLHCSVITTLNGSAIEQTKNPKVINSQSLLYQYEPEILGVFLREIFHSLFAAAIQKRSKLKHISST